MDFDKIKKIKSFVDQIKKFRNLDCHKNLNNEEFKKRMIPIFPKFNKEMPILFDNVVLDRDLSILNLMFQKLNIIEIQFNKRLDEVKIIKPFVESAMEYLKDKKKVTKNQLYNHFRKNKRNYPTDYNNFINKYPVIIERLIDDDDYDFNPASLLYKQVKFSHEIEIGKVLTQKYVEPYVKK